jgi:hypothetical protein
VGDPLGRIFVAGQAADQVPCGGGRERVCSR